MNPIAYNQTHHLCRYVYLRFVSADNDFSGNKTTDSGEFIWNEPIIKILQTIKLDLPAKENNLKKKKLRNVIKDHQGSTGFITKLLKFSKIPSGGILNLFLETPDSIQKE